MTPLAEARTERQLPPLPGAADFSERPATWYLFCRASDLKHKPLSKSILQRRLVAYRTPSGAVAVLDAACAHLGADLGRGRVVGDEIQCPFHHWHYGPHGRCVSIPQSDQIPEGARLRSYPAVERHGYVYFFFGRQALFPLPFFPGCDPAEFLASPTFAFEADCPWFMLVANGFDGQHFRAVHDRKLMSIPRVDCPIPLARRMRLEAEVVGSSIFDRLLKIFVGKRVNISIAAWGGAYVLVEGEFEKAHSRLLVASQPLDENRTLCEVMVFAKRRGGLLGPVADWVNLRIRRRFTQAFLQNDIDKLSGIRYQPSGLTPQDRELVDYFRWLTTLPRSEYEAEQQ